MVLLTEQSDGKLLTQAPASCYHHRDELENLTEGKIDVSAVPNAAAFKGKKQTQAAWDQHRCLHQTEGGGRTLSWERLKTDWTGGWGLSLMRPIKYFALWNKEETDRQSGSDSNLFCMKAPVYKLLVPHPVLQDTNELRERETHVPGQKTPPEQTLPGSYFGGVSRRLLEAEAQVTRLLL